MAEEGIHAVLFVLSTKSRISQEEESTLNTLQRIFECKILDYFIVVFTGGDELEDEGQTLDDYLLDSCPEFLTVCLLSLLFKILFLGTSINVSAQLSAFIIYLNYIKIIYVKKKNNSHK